MTYRNNLNKIFTTVRRHHATRCHASHCVHPSHNSRCVGATNGQWMGAWWARRCSWTLCDPRKSAFQTQTALSTLGTSARVLLCSGAYKTMQ